MILSHRHRAAAPGAEASGRPDSHSIDELLAQQRDVGLLRFITCGSVDDGKSTLIGRLLHDTRQVLDDHLAALANDSRRWGTTGDAPDLALLVDGLQAEREQGITIDVAYRYFQTRNRKFIVADCPGHEQYTRNMATGASNADAAVLLVDAQMGMRVQTRRHAHIVALLGVQDVILAVNKMDRNGFDRARFEAIAGEFAEYAGKLGIRSVAVPIAALTGANVVARAAETAWYRGATLIEALENLEPVRGHRQTGLRFPIQLVSRPDSKFRGYAGTVATGRIAVGDAIVALPSQRTSRVREITTADGPLKSADAHMAVTVVLEDDMDVSRGDLFVHPEHRPTIVRSFDAHIIWMDEAPLLPGRRYEFKLGHRYLKGIVELIRHRIDVNTLATEGAEALELNGLARCRVTLDEAVPVDDYRNSRATGSFVMIDLLHHGTVGAGMVIEPVSGPFHASPDVVLHPTKVSPRVRANQKSQRPCVVWFTGLSGAGKSTLANMLEQALVQRGHHSYLLDGDNLRHGLNSDLDFSDAGRTENLRRIGELSALFVDAGLIVIAAFISPFRADRERVRERIGDDAFVEVYLSTPLAACEQRDPKGLYARARAGQIREFTGIDSPYEPPRNPSLEIDTSTVDSRAAAERILRHLEGRGFLHVTHAML